MIDKKTQHEKKNKIYIYIYVYYITPRLLKTVQEQRKNIIYIYTVSHQEYKIIRK